MKVKDREIKVGDRVRVIRDSDPNKMCPQYAPIGYKGTVVYIEGCAEPTRQIAVKFDSPFTKGHSCSGRIPVGRSQWYSFSPEFDIYWRDWLEIIPKKKTNNYY